MFAYSIFKFTRAPFILVRPCNHCGQVFELSSSVFEKRKYCNDCSRINKTQRLKNLKFNLPLLPVRLKRFNITPRLFTLVRLCKNCGLSFGLIDKRKRQVEYCGRTRSCSSKMKASERRLSRLSEKKKGRCLGCGKEFIYTSRGKRKRVTCGSKACLRRSFLKRDKEKSFGRRGKRWTQEEMERLRLASQNFTISELSAIFGRSQESIKKMKLKLRIKRTENRLRTGEVAKALGISRWKVQFWIQKKELRAEKKASRFYIEIDDLVSFLLNSRLADASLPWQNLGITLRRHELKPEVPTVERHSETDFRFCPCCERSFSSEENYGSRTVCPECFAKGKFSQGNRQEWIARHGERLSTCWYCKARFYKANPLTQESYCSEKCKELFGEKKERRRFGNVLRILRELYEKHEGNLDKAFLELKKLYDMKRGT